MRILVICTLLSASFAAFAHDARPINTPNILKTACSDLKSGPVTAAPKACFVKIDGLDGEQLALEYSRGAPVFSLNDIKAGDKPNSFVANAINVGLIFSPGEKTKDYFLEKTLILKKQVFPKPISVRMEYEDRDLKRLTIKVDNIESVYENFIAQ